MHSDGVQPVFPGQHTHGRVSQNHTRYDVDLRKVLSLSKWICREVPDISLRRDLARRIDSYLSGRRRGNLRLPHSLRAVQSLTKLSKTQIRQVAYCITCSMSGRFRINDSTSSYLHRVVPGRIWTDNNFGLLKRQLGVVKRLPSKHKPRGARSAWPSTFDVFETIERTRRGFKTPGLDHCPLVVKHHLTRRQVSDDIRLAGSIVSNCIVGIRASVEVPVKFLQHFRSRHGFLILTTRYKIPSGLIRFLISRWISMPTSLWLVEPCQFKKFLNRHVQSDFIRQYGPSRPVIDRASMSHGLADQNSHISAMHRYIGACGLTLEQALSGYYPPFVNRR